MEPAAASRIVMHPDPLRLETELARRVHEAATGRPLARILVVAPSGRQVLRLRESLARDLGGAAGVDVLNYQGLAFRILDAGAEPLPRIASGPLLSALTRHLLDSIPDGDLRNYASLRPAAVTALARLLGELGEAGVRPADLRAADGSPRIAPVADLLEAYRNAVREDAPGGWTDRGGFIRLAIRRAAAFPPVRAVFAVGAYELIGVHLELLRAVPSETGITYLVPADPEAPAWKYARDFLERHLPGDPEPPEPAGSDRPFVAAARALGDPGPRPETPLDPGAVRLVHVQGPEAELTFAARKALKLVQDGADPETIGIVARTLEPFAALAETVFARHGLRVDASAALPLCRFPKVRAFLLLLEALSRDFERRAVIELTRSPHLERGTPSGEADGLWWPGTWDRWSRSLALVGGSRTWIEELPDRIDGEPAPPWAESGSPEEAAFKAEKPRRLASARLLADLVSRWVEEREAWDRCRTAAEHTAFLRDLGRRWIRGWDQVDSDRPETSRAVNAALEQSLVQIEGLEWALEPAARGRDGGGTRPLVSGRPSLARDAVFDFLTRALEEATVPWRQIGGVRFLDFMQARGLAFGHLVLIGMNEGLVPRRPREDPFLPDRVREQLRGRTQAPLAVRREGRDEERLLLAGVLCAARESLTVTWQRADSNGRALAPSPALRDLVRLLPGAPTLKAILGPGAPFRPARVPAHPTEAATWFGENTGLVTLLESALLVGDRAGGAAPARLRTFLEGTDPDLAARLASGFGMIETVERFAGADLAYDGWVPGGTGGGERAFSATGLKRMGNCPQTYFFRHVLGVSPLRDEAEAFRFEARELGSHMHLLLERVLRDLDRDGLLDGEGDPDRMVEAAHRALEARWDEVLGAAAERIRRRFPLLQTHADAYWRRELRDFLDRDLRRLAAGGHRLEALETPWNRTLEFPGTVAASVRALFGPAAPVSLPVLGIPDRVTRDRRGAWLVSDYKTSGKIAKDVEPKHYLTGDRVQVPLYVLLAEGESAGARVGGELLGLGPVFDPVEGEAPQDAPALSPETFDTTREGFQETLAVLAAGAEAGRFPIFAGFHCRWCDFQPACRRHHYPTRERVEHAEAYRPLHKLRKKGVKKPLLADIPDDDEDDEEDTR